MEDKFTLLNRLKELRVASKISQSELADIVGVSRNTISSIETGQYCPTAKLAYSICIALNKKFEEVFYFDNYTLVTNVDEKSDFNLSHKAIQRINEYMMAKGWGAEQILDFLLYITK